MNLNTADDYLNFITARNKVKKNKNERLKIELDWFLRCGGIDIKQINPEILRIVSMNQANENSFEKELHSQVESLFSLNSPFYITWNTRKKAAWNGCYYKDEFKIEIFAANATHKYGPKCGEYSEEETRGILIHEYAHHIQHILSKWDNGEHGDVFEAVHFCLLKLAKKQGYYNSPMDIDEDHFHNKMKNNVFFPHIVERMGLDLNELLNENDVIKTFNPNNYSIMVY